MASVSSGRNISKEVKAVPHDISRVPSLEIPPYPGELSEFWDVTRILETPTTVLVIERRVWL